MLCGQAPAFRSGTARAASAVVHGLHDLVLVPAGGTDTGPRGRFVDLVLVPAGKTDPRPRLTEDPEALGLPSALKLSTRVAKCGAQSHHHGLSPLTASWSSLTTALTTVQAAVHVRISAAPRMSECPSRFLHQGNRGRCPTVAGTNGHFRHAKQGMSQLSAHIPQSTPCDPDDRRRPPSPPAGPDMRLPHPRHDHHGMTGCTCQHLNHQTMRRRHVRLAARQHGCWSEVEDGA